MGAGAGAGRRAGSRGESSSGYTETLTPAVCSVAYMTLRTSC